MSIRSSTEIERGSSQGLFQPGLLVALNALYIGLGIVMGLIQGGLPPIMMSLGWDVAQAGWAYAFYIPFALAFLWAPLVDRYSFPFLTRRIGWVIAMQMVTILAFLGIAYAASDQILMYVILGFVAVFSMATMDLALDGFAVETVSSRARSWASGAKLAALGMGAIIGSGVLVAQFDTLGWQNTFKLLAVLLTLLSVPILFLREPKTKETEIKSRPSLFVLLRSTHQRKRLLQLILVCCIIFPASGLNRLMLASMNVPLTQIGWIVGTLGPIAMIVASALSIPLMTMFGYRRTLLVFGCICLGSLAVLLYGVVNINTALLMAGSIVIGGSVGGIFVVYAAQVLGWARGQQAATDYSAFYGLGRVGATIATLLGAQLAGYIGWTTFYAVLSCLFVFLLIHFYQRDGMT